MLPRSVSCGPLAGRGVRVSMQRLGRSSGGVGQDPGLGNLVRRGSHPAAVAASVVSADILPSPAVRITLCHTKFSRELTVCLAAACLK